MRRVLKLAAACLLAVGLVACGSSSGQASDDKSPAASKDWNSALYEKTIALKDGRIVTCVMTGNGGISCDFANAAKPD